MGAPMLVRGTPKVRRTLTDLVVVGRLKHFTVHGCIKPARKRGHTHIDLSRMVWTEPIGIVAICAFAERAVQQGKKVTFTPPDDTSIANYLDRIGLTKVLDEFGIKHGISAVRRNDVGQRLVELTRFDGTDEVEELSQNVHSAALAINEKAANGIANAICTAGENVSQHSGRTNGYYVLQRTNSSTFVRFAVGDSGRGFRRALESRKPEDDAAALLLALTKGVSGTGNIGRGLGLHSLADELKKVGGGLVLISGDARHVRSDSAELSQTYDAVFRGSLIEGFIRVSST